MTRTGRPRTPVRAASGPFPAPGAPPGTSGWPGRLARLPWLLLAALVLAQIGYPLTGGTGRDRLTVATVVLGFLLSVGHALLSRGPRTAVALVAVTGAGGLAVEAVGVATGLPFGGYAYSGDLGPRLAGVPLVIPLAWTWMAWPAWLAAVRLTGGAQAGAARHTGAVRAGTNRRTGGARAGAVGRIGLAGLGLAAWDVFLDPQMVAEGYWTWRNPHPALPGVPGVPVGNYLGWLLVAVAMMALLWRTAAAPARVTTPDDAPMHLLYLWTYASSVLAHAVFLDLPGSALWGALAMSALAVPLARGVAAPWFAHLAARRGPK
ncbi:carotenoid biosynthesis protein [Micromonospora sp. NPDC049559]|uniref:carotenoid biosynthesis protein n=1 Tax=Micromonospora sp. NPDC049559 TaxID=3155923 RepID=UPI00341E9E26